MEMPYPSVMLSPTQAILVTLLVQDDIAHTRLIIKIIRILFIFKNLV